MVKYKEKLKEVSESFRTGTFFIPLIGSEIEFYLSGKIPGDIVSIIEKSCLAAAIPIMDVNPEKGKGQYEISLMHSEDVITIADSIENIKKLVQKIADEIEIVTDFSAKPFTDDYGSAMHIHLSLRDSEGNNPFCKNGDDESLVMQYAIGGLLQSMPDSMQYFAPTDNCYKRYVAKMDAPTTISWGGNNRTVALRLPTTTHNPQARRIEHRVASSAANPYEVIASVLDASHLGIINKTLPISEKIYGDASDPQYYLPKILV